MTQNANAETSLSETRKAAITESLSFLGKRLRDVYVDDKSPFAIVTIDPLGSGFVSDIIWERVEAQGWKMTTFKADKNGSYDLHFGRVEAFV